MLQLEENRIYLRFLFACMTTRTRVLDPNLPGLLPVPVYLYDWLR